MIQVQQHNDGHDARKGHVTLVLKVHTYDADKLIALGQQLAQPDTEIVTDEVTAAWELVLDAWVKAYDGPGPADIEFDGPCSGSEWYPLEG